MQTNAQQDRSSDPPERPTRPPSAPPGAPPEPSDDAAVQALYEQLFGEPPVDPPPDPMQAFCLVYELIRRRPELMGTVRAAAQSAENAFLAQEHELAAGGGGRHE